MLEWAEEPFRKLAMEEGSKALGGLTSEKENLHTAKEEVKDKLRQIVTP